AMPGQYIRRQGEDVAVATTLLTSGTRIRAAEVGLLATLGRALPLTIRPARVAVISTGDEVVEIEEGVTPPPGKIRNSNAYTLEALVREAGAVVHSRRHLPDDPEATEQALRECVEQGADVIVTAGGVSVGDRDFVKPALEKLGELELWRVAMKPGKPLAFGHIGETLFFGLPGNPVSVMVTFELFVRPTLGKMAGYPEAALMRRAVSAMTTETISHTPGRREYVRAITTYEDGKWSTRPTGGQGSGNLHSMAQANSLMVLPGEVTEVSVGEAVNVLLLE
ncbi:MAG TPA: gephyrin-like molybdotransferase Glp, partial [Chthonomonadaceae bacterium]|nr:gephyrin-like molybdotransferase Glp [Chthonomonadaceae bacterium]